jgi:hypothetical protein
MARAKRKDEQEPTKKPAEISCTAEMSGKDVVIRVRLEGPGSSALPAVITQANCAVVGLTSRQFLELVRDGVIPGGALPGRKIITALTEDVLAVVRAAAKPHDPTDQDEEDAVNSVLTETGYEACKPKR